MRLLISYVCSNKIKTAAVILLSVLQAVFCITVPQITGRMISVGIQKKGFEENYPAVVSRTVYGLFTKLLPEREKETFSRLYTANAEEAVSVSEKYATDRSCCFLADNADAEEAAKLYENAVFAVILAARESDSVNKYDFDELFDKVSLESVNIYVNSVELSEEEKLAYYERSASAARPLKIQAANILLPYIYENARIDCDAVQEKYLKNQALSLVLCTVCELLCAGAASYLIAGISSATEKKLRTDILNKAFRLSDAFLDNMGAGALENAAVNGCSQVGMAVNYAFGSVFFSAAAALFGCISAFRLNFYFGLCIPAAALLILGAVFLIYKLTYSRYYRMQENYGRYSSSVKKSLRHMLTERLSDISFSEKDTVKRNSGEVRRDESFVMKAVLSALTASGLIINVLIAVMVVFGLSDMLRSDLSLGTVVVFVQYSVIILSAFITLGTVLIFSPKAFAAMEDITRILSAEERTETAEVGLPCEKINALRFEKLRIFADSQPLTFTVPSGKILAVTGKSGSGKTTLADVILGRTKPYDGKMTVIGSDGSERGSNSGLRVVYEPSEPVLFSGTVKNNMLVRGTGDDDKTLADALKDAQCDFLPKGEAALNVVLKNRGGSFSGGQRSRLSLAASFAKKGDVYILDDCLSSLDRNVRDNVFKKLNELKKDAAVILITHDAEDAACADMTVELKRGAD